MKLTISASCLCIYSLFVYIGNSYSVSLDQVHGLVYKNLQTQLQQDDININENNLLRKSEVIYRMRRSHNEEEDEHYRGGKKRRRNRHNNKKKDNGSLGLYVGLSVPAVLLFFFILLIIFVATRKRCVFHITTSDEPDIERWYRESNTPIASIYGTSLRSKEEIKTPDFLVNQCTIETNEESKTNNENKDTTSSKSESNDSEHDRVRTESSNSQKLQVIEEVLENGEEDFSSRSHEEENEDEKSIVEIKDEEKLDSSVIQNKNCINNNITDDNDAQEDREDQVSVYAVD